MRIALVDADILAYQSAAASEHPVDWGDGLWTLHSFEQDAIASFESSLDRLREKVEADSMLLVFTDKDNWRKKVLPTYKGNRAATRKPMLLKFLRQYAEDNYKCMSMANMEGDDVIGIQTTLTDGLDTVVCSIDKDFKTIPGYHYNFGKDEFFVIDNHQADYWHMMQTLTGDTTDGYAGCPGIGPVTAKKILDRVLEDGTPWADRKMLRKMYWQAVVKAYDKAGLGEEEALVQARVARICRAEDYDFEKGEVILWKP